MNQPLPKADETATVAGGDRGGLPSSRIATLRRVTTWDEWEAGRAARRALAMQITGGNILRRSSGNPRKDALLRRLNRGDRGLPFL
jgi:hypothetical protein